jgi:N-acetyl-alpha-D-muramate 1-phosphate uridylyltransferase
LQQTALPTTALLLAAGRGERMRPLTDTCPKPLLAVRGKPLIVWHIERLAQFGVTRIVINTAWLGEQFEAALGSGAQWGVSLAFSHEGSALETAGAIAQARPLLGTAPFWVVSADIFAPDFDYAAPELGHFMRTPELQAHLFMVPNPPFHPNGDYAITADGFLANEGAPRLTFANFGVYRMELVAKVKAGERAKLAPYFSAAAAEQRVTASLFRGQWENVGTPVQLAALNG